MRKLLLLLSVISVFPILSQLYEMPVYSVTSLQPSSGVNAVKFAIDNNLNTVYQSQAGQIGIPDELNCFFSSQVTSIKKMTYIPRQTGTNGLWTSLSVYYSTQSDPTNFILSSANIAWVANNQSKDIILPTAIQNPFCIKFVIHAGAGNYSSCAEMKFFSETQVLSNNGTDCTISTASMGLSGANDIKATVIANGTTASSTQSGSGINRSFDNNNSTYYISNGGANLFPILLNYRFNGTTPIDKIKYIPRGYNNFGNFGTVIITYNTTANATFQTLTTHNFAQTGLAETINLPFQITPLNIRISVQDGAYHYASCVEMEFYTAEIQNQSYANVFADNVYSTLKPTVTQANIDTITNVFYKDLAQCIFNQTYVHQYRVQQYEVYPTTGLVSQNLKIGTYDAFENPTGIAFAQNEKIVLFAANIDPYAPVKLLVKNFQTSLNGVGSSFNLQNGVNVIQLTNGGMAYIDYFNNDTTFNDVKINIVSGKINGFFDRETSTSADWVNLLTKTTYPYVDIRGKYTHLVFERAALKANNPFGGLNLIGKYDTIAQHERNLMGLFKFNRSPKNRQLIYSNHGGGFNAGGLGVNLDLDWGADRITVPNKFNLWGIAHELGHINQIRPALNWIGMAEVTNNIYSTWVGYNYGQTWENYSGPHPIAGIPNITGTHINGAVYKTMIKNRHLQDSTDYDLGNILAPFWQLQIYYQIAGASRNAPALTVTSPANPPGIDYAHWFGIVAEKVRTTNPGGSNGQHVLNFVKNTCEAVQEDLTDYFLKTGYLKPIDQTIISYSTGQLTITQAQIDQTIAEIKAMNYTLPVSPVMNYASTYSKNMYKNKAPLSGVTGANVSLSGYYLTVNHSGWHNAVAYETYDANQQLIFVSITGTGDNSNNTTKVYYPSTARSVYAIGYDGQKILVYPAGATPPPAPSFTASTTTTCIGQTVTYTNTSYNATTLKWNFGLGASPATATGPGPHNVTYSTIGSKTVALTINGSLTSYHKVVEVNDIPVAPIISEVINCGNSVLTANGTALVWSTGATTNSITVTNTNPVTVTQTANGCTSTPASFTPAPKTIPAVPVVTVANNCGNSVLTTSGTALVWSTGATTNSITVTNTNPVTVTQTANGCTSTPATATPAPIAIPIAPIVTMVNNCGNSVLTTSGTALVWSTGATTNSITVNNTNPVTVTQTVNGCTSTPATATPAPIAIPIAPIVTMVNNCGNSVLTTSGTDLSWSTGETTTDITVTNTNPVTVSQTVNGCQSTPATLTPTPIAIPVAPIVTMVNNCGNSVLTTSGTDLSWSTGENTSQIIVTNSTPITVTQTVNGCQSAPTSVTPAPKVIPVVTISTLPILCTYNSPITLTQGSPSGGTYSGVGISGNDIFTPTLIGNVNITYTYTAANNCSNTASAQLIVGTCLNVEEVEENNFVVFPNPTNGEVNLKSSSVIQSIVIIDNTGRIIQQFDGENATTMTLDLSHLTNGSYYLQTKANDTMRNVLLIIQH